jgi:hypothetical protein
MTDNIFEQYRDFVRHGDELTVVVLKGHLAIEELLGRILAATIGNESLIEEARLSFHQKRILAQARSGQRNADAGWQIIQTLNKLRNDIGHSLEATRSNALIDRLRQLLRERDPQAFNLIPNPDNNVELVSHVVSFLIGFLGAYLRECGA